MDAMVVVIRDHPFSDEEAQKAWERRPVSFKFHSFLFDLYVYNQPYIFQDIDDEDSKTSSINFVLKVAQALSLQLEPFVTVVEAFEGADS